MTSRLLNRCRHRRRLAHRAPAAVAALMLLAGCSTAQTAALAGISVVSFMETDKFLSDHIASNMLHKDCSMKHTLDGEKWCQDEQPANGATTVAQATPYCYRTLGTITCYDSPNPHDPRANLVQWPRAPEPGTRLARRDAENEGN